MGSHFESESDDVDSRRNLNDLMAQWQNRNHNVKIERFIATAVGLSTVPYTVYGRTHIGPYGLRVYRNPYRSFFFKSLNGTVWEHIRPLTALLRVHTDTASVFK